MFLSKATHNECIEPQNKILTTKMKEFSGAKTNQALVYRDVD